MNCCPAAHKLAAVVIGVYGLLTLGGGIWGYVSKGSKASLIAGVVAGVVLLLCVAGTAWSPRVSFSVAVLVALALLVQFAPKVWEHRNELYDFAATGPGRTAVLMTGGGLMTVLAALYGLLTRAGPTS
ncbi:MAG: TMEM14 family protein [Gemmataceae bacterium]|nr:TMEM14 family protein [Gemmataceae bacterium]MDW8265298.1 TMEM14 family protein [Gemmataceae bacterium]